MPPIQRPPGDGTGGGDDKKSPLERYLEKQKSTRDPKPPRENLESRRSSFGLRANVPTPPVAPNVPSAPSLSKPDTVPVVPSAPPQAPTPNAVESRAEAPRSAVVGQITQQKSGAPEPIAADVFTRLVASVVDFVTVTLISWIVTKVVVGALSLLTTVSPEARLGIEFLLWYVVIFFYYGTFYATKGASPGKLLMGLEIYDDGTGRFLTPGKAFLRESFGKLISAIPFFIGYLVVLFRDDRRALHDLLFDTRVVRNIRTLRSDTPIGKSN